MSTARAKQEHQEHNDTAELLVDALEDSYVSNPGTMMTIDVAAKTDRGLVRLRNVDHYLVLRFRRSLENISTNLELGSAQTNYDSTGYGLLVADGLGGRIGGEVASRTALTKLIELIIETPDWIMGFEDHDKVEAVLE